MRLAALLLALGAAVYGGVPEKITHATPYPDKAQAFVERHFGLLRRYFHFGSETSAQCADITWNLICQNPKEFRSDARSDDWNWEWNIHFVHTPMHPQGPMNLSVLTKHAHGALSAAAERDEWSDWHTLRTGYMVRDLTPIVASLAADGVPFLLTHRDDHHAERRALTSSRGSSAHPPATPHRAPSAVTSSATHSRGSSAARPPTTSHRAPSARSASSTNRTASFVDAAWRKLDDQIARNHRVARLYSLYVEIPEGIVWEITSEIFDQKRADGTQSVPLRRPCDQHPLEDTPQMVSPRDANKLGALYGKAAFTPGPNPTAIVARHHTYPSLDPLADARDVFELLELSSGPPAGQYRYVTRANGACAAIVAMNGVTELRFERVEPTDGGGDGYSIRDFMRYQATLHRASLRHGDYNSYMDSHLAFFMGVTNPQHKDAQWSRSGNDFSLWSRFGDALASSKRPHLIQGRNQFESVFVLTRNSSSVVQFIWVNAGVMMHKESIDYPIPGCKNANWEEIAKYEDLLENGSTPMLPGELYASHQTRQSSRTSHTPAPPSRTSTHASSAVGSAARTRDHSHAEPDRHIDDLDAEIEMLEARLETVRQQQADRLESRLGALRKQKATQGQRRRSLASGPSSAQKAHHSSADAAQGSPLSSKEFDLCDRGSAALGDWTHFECNSHLGPCCGDGICQVDLGETSQRCRNDCA